MGPEGRLKIAVQIQAQEGKQTKRLLRVLWTTVITYLVFCVVLFNANESHCNWLHNEDYLEGCATVTYHSSAWNW